MNSGWSNVELRGQIIIKYHEFTIHGNLMKQGKLKSSDLELRLERYPYFKVKKNSNQIWAKMNNKSTLNAKLTI